MPNDIDSVKKMFDTSYTGYRIERGHLYDFIITDCDDMIPEAFVMMSFSKDGSFTGIHPMYKGVRHG